MAKIAVIGAGIAGCAAALFLQRQGHEVSIFEAQAAMDRINGAGLLLQPAGMAVLKQLEILSPVLMNGARINALFGTTLQQRLVLNLQYNQLHPDYHGLGIERHYLFKLLQQQVTSDAITIHWQVHIQGIKQREHTVILTDEYQQQYIDFDGVIVANGRRSNIHQTCDIWRKIIPYPWGALWAICPELTETTQQKQLRQVYDGTRKMLGILPVGIGNEINNKVSFFWSLPNNQLTNWQQQPLQQWKDEVLKLYPALNKMLDTINDHKQLSFASYNDIYMKDFHKHRIVFIGDAAHSMSPQLGQGANLALIDAALLANHLCQENDIPTAYANYNRQRKQAIKYYQRLSRMMTPIFQSYYPGLNVVRDQCFHPLSKIPFVNHLMLATLACVKPSLWRSTEVVIKP